MKIIGKSSGSGFIVLATEDELCKIMGYNSVYSMKREAERPDLGMEIRVSELYAALEVSRGRKKEIEELSASLRKIANRVDTINEALAAPIVEVTVKT